MMAGGRNADGQVATVESVRDKIRPLLAGIGPDNQGAVLADLLAMWLAGHPPQLREDLLTMHVLMVRKLMPVNVRALVEREGLMNWE